MKQLLHQRLTFFLSSEIRQVARGAEALKASVRRARVRRRQIWVAGDVLAHHRVRAEVLGARDCAVAGVGAGRVGGVQARGGERDGCGAVLDPSAELVEGVVGDEAGAAAAVADAGRVELAVEGFDKGVERGNFLVVVHVALRHDEVVRQTLPGDHLAAVRLEG